MTNAADYKEEFQHIDWLISHSLYHAAIEQCHSVALTNDPCLLAHAHDRIGICYMELGMNEEALKWFLLATSQPDTLPIADVATFQVHLAILYDHLCEFDRAQRVLVPLVRNVNHLSIETAGLVYANLAVSFYRNGLYTRALENSLKCLEQFHEADIHRYDGAIYHNLGCYCFELDDLNRAKRYLELSEHISAGRFANTVELARVSMKCNNIEGTLANAHQALNLAYRAIIQSEKEDLAKICQVSGQLSASLGDVALAARLLEKAQIYYGEAGFWTEWERIDQESRLIRPARSNAVVHLDAQTVNTFLDEANRFLTFLDMMSAQELLGEDYRFWFDSRVLLAEELAKEMHIDNESSVALIYACRLADFGLTALEERVLLDPHRSPSAWSQYRLHPELSVKMVDWMGLPEVTFTMIAQHHERYDGLGYPEALPATHIHPLSYIIAVADEYARRVTLENQTHSQAARAILRESGQAFHPDVVRAFEHLFKGPA